LQLAKLDPESKGFLLSLIVGILLVVMLTILIVTGLWGTFTKNDRMVHSFAGNWVFIFVLVVIQCILVAVAFSQCNKEDIVNMFIDCTADPFETFYYNAIGVAVFAVFAAIVGFVLASVIKSDNRKGYDY
jgi:hypothetical protein